MNYPAPSANVERNLKLIWLNGPTGVEPALNIPVHPTINLSECLEDIFKLTSDLAKSTDPNHYVEETNFNPDLLQILQTNSALTPEEYNTSISYFVTAIPGDEKPPLLLNTKHCGKLILRLVPGNDGEERTLNFDLGKDTLADLINAVAVLGDTNYIFTDSILVQHPLSDVRKDKILIRNVDIPQFSEIMSKKRVNLNEIGVTVNVSAEEKRVFPFFCDLDITVSKLKELLQEKTGIESIKQRVVVVTGVGKEETQLEDSKTLRHCGLEDGSIISISVTTFTDSASGYGFSSKFADTTEEVEVIPKSRKKYEKSSKGLNLKCQCNNPKCKIHERNGGVISHWPHPTFDLIKDSSKVVCPECIEPMKVLSPLFFLTQWKFYGRKANSTVRDGALESETSNLCTCDWQISDDPDSCAGFTVLDKPDLQVGIVDWTSLLIMTRDLPKKKPDRPKTEWLKFAIGFDLPVMIGIKFDWDWFRSYE